MDNKSRRQPSSSGSSSTSAASSKGRLIFKKPTFSRIISRDEKLSSDRSLASPTLDRTRDSPILPGLELRLSNDNGIPFPDRSVPAPHDSELLQIRENIRRIKQVSSGSDPKKVDEAWEIYKKQRGASLHLCRCLMRQSKINQHASLESSTEPVDATSSISDPLIRTCVPSQDSEQCLSAVKEYQLTQESLLGNIQSSLKATYKVYEWDASDKQFQGVLSDKVLRKNFIDKWSEESPRRPKSEKHLFWEHYRIRFLNSDQLKLDLQFIKSLFGEAEDGQAMAIREYIIAKDGDTILEFANAASESHPILRFRVSSHLLAAASPFFRQFLSPQKSGSGLLLEMIGELPPPPSRYTCKDGIETKVFQMPQLELNNNKALSLLFHAVHMHNSKISRQIDFQTFVSIAEVCLRYQCTAPLELQVEYQWLPQHVHTIGDDNNTDGLLLISYAFGLRRIFTRVSKSAISNATSDEEIQGKTMWPQAVRDKIKAIRAAKMAQIQVCCTAALGEYFRTPPGTGDGLSKGGSLQMTSQTRCPKGSHVCDATNLGWIMLVYNELRILPTILKDAGSLNLPALPQRSFRELIECLRRMPSAPQVHSGVCDYVAAFRSNIDDIYNSVRGLTLYDVSGKNGWALSKHANAPENRLDDYGDQVENDVPLEYTRNTRRQTATWSEDISLQILTHLSNMQDLSSAAMVNKNFYHAYKQNKEALLKIVAQADTRGTTSQAHPDLSGVQNDRRSLSIANVLYASSMSLEDRQLPPATARNRDGSNDLYDASPPLSLKEIDDENERDEEVPMSEAEAHQILWPESISAQLSSSSSQITKGNSRDRVQTKDSMENEKVLLGDVVQGEKHGEKSRVKKEDKHLREEKDRALGLGRLLN
ncbi:hypothetical protein VTL71DRAFT_6527 [Oculimacula yallundae]|uniref:BTB domain-containing protein n=1 Tax=Oculimacula yallundae TaxID=86028 RepID=A0ABR4BX82_9HELO